jgi:hypothetical protein
VLKAKNLRDLAFLTIRQIRTIAGVETRLSTRTWRTTCSRPRRRPFPSAKLPAHAFETMMDALESPRRRRSFQEERRLAWRWSAAPRQTPLKGRRTSAAGVRRLDSGDFVTLRACGGLEGSRQSRSARRSALTCRAVQRPRATRRSRRNFAGVASELDVALISDRWRLSRGQCYRRLIDDAADAQREATADSPLRET